MCVRRSGGARAAGVSLAISGVAVHNFRTAGILLDPALVSCVVIIPPHHPLAEKYEPGNNQNEKEDGFVPVAEGTYPAHVSKFESNAKTLLVRSIICLAEQADLRTISEEELHAFRVAWAVLRAQYMISMPFRRSRPVLGSMDAGVTMRRLGHS